MFDPPPYDVSERRCEGCHRKAARQEELESERVDMSGLRIGLVPYVEDEAEGEQ